MSAIEPQFTAHRLQIACRPHAMHRKGDPGLGGTRVARRSEPGHAGIALFGGSARRHQDFPVAVGLHGRDQPALLHLLQQPRRPVVANAQMSLDQ